MRVTGFILVSKVHVSLSLQDKLSTVLISYENESDDDLLKYFLWECLFIFLLGCKYFISKSFFF
jgi:hypothetical protein